MVCISCRPQCLGRGCYNNLPGAEDRTESGIGFLIPCQQAWWVSPDGKVTSKQPGPAPVQGANRHSREALTRSSDEVHAQGKNPCTVHKHGKLRVTGQSMPDDPHRKQNSPERPRDEHQTRHLTENMKWCVYKSSAKWWKNDKTCQGWNLSLFLWHFSVKELIYCRPWYSLLRKNFVIACPTATT